MYAAIDVFRMRAGLRYCCSLPMRTRCLSLLRFIDEHCAEGTNRVLSAPFFYELLPEGVSKAYGYKQLLRVTGSEDRFTVAAGDYPNDAEMVRSADLGVAVSNAHDEVKSSADVIIGSNNEDPMTQIIDIIRKK